MSLESLFWRLACMFLHVNADVLILLAVVGLLLRNALHEEGLVHVAADGEEDGHGCVQQVQRDHLPPLVSGDPVGERCARVNRRAQVSPLHLCKHHIHTQMRYQWSYRLILVFGELLALFWIVNRSFLS